MIPFSYKGGSILYLPFQLTCLKLKKHTVQTTLFLVLYTECCLIVS